ncbi:MAG: hypothetical protein HYT66_00900 [Candidatus Yanofskybacteria bacterium]|nr:hypothetical protein [Candidatus Yanofskybacteria bacterium]
MDDILSVIRRVDFSKLSENLNLGPTTLLVGLALVFMILYGLSLGKIKALISLLGIYVALAFDAAFPYLEQLHDALPIEVEIYATRLVVFMLMYLLTFAILNKSFASKRLTLKDSSIISVSVISLTQIGLLVAVITNIIPDEIIEKMPEYLSAYFATKEALFFWMIIPILILIFLRKSKRKNAVE